jgi:hypothetical protein
MSDPERMTDSNHIAVPEDTTEDANKIFTYSSTRQKWKNFSRKSGRYAAAKVAFY